jgi:D-glycero-D-manno-heptose 1,7-bisphosphate phosphatase
VSRRAVFLDRDGTIITDVHYLGKPDHVELLPGAAIAIRRLNQARLPVIVVTNQSGIARGYFTEAEYRTVQSRVEDLLDREGAHIDATFMCPHHPDFTGPCDCRKPGVLLFRRASEEFGLELDKSWYVGDKLRDILPAGELGGVGILIPNEETPPDETELARKESQVAPTLDAAVGRIIKSAR